MKKFLIIWMVLVTFMVCKNAVSPELPDLVKNVDPTVVQVKIQNEYGRKWLGSGVIVHERGLILTAKHVIVDSNDITVVLTDGTVYKGVNKIVDPNNDIGIIHIAPLKDLPTIEFGDDVRVGEKVFIVGSPFGLCNSVAFGIVAGKNRYIPYFGSGFMLQLDIAGNPGNSGSPIFDMTGKVIGIMVGGKWGGDGVTIVVPVDKCKRLLERYVENNH